MSSILSLYLLKKSSAPEKATWFIYLSTSSAVIPIPLSSNFIVLFFLLTDTVILYFSSSDCLTSPRETNLLYLLITAQKNTSNDDKDEEGNYIRRERYCGKCSRSFYVGDSIKEEDIKANFNNGILELTFPKEVEQKAEEMKYITID